MTRRSSNTTVGMQLWQTIKSAFSGFRRQVHRSSSKYTPYHGVQECARRVRQMKQVMLDYGRK